MVHYKLTYFELNARGEPIRMMFALAGVQFEDVRISIQERICKFEGTPILAPSKLEVDGVKLGKSLVTVRHLAQEYGTPFLAFPMLEVDGVKIGQTIAIVRYLANEFGLAGPDNLTAALADGLCDQMTDFVMSWMPWHFANQGFVEGGDVPALYEQYFVPARAKHLPFFEDALRKSPTGWLVGTRDVTHADVFIAASLEWIGRVTPASSSLLDGFPLLQAHQHKFFAHPKLQKHLAERPAVVY